MQRLLALLAAFCLAACAPSAMKELPIQELPQIPDAAYAKGVSAPFCGLLDGQLVVAGGANFPDKSLLDGGAKRVYRDIWAFDGTAWHHAGLLPDSTAYGATFTLPGQLLFAGGNVCGTTTARIVALTAQGIQPAGELPFPVEQAGATQDGEVLYLVGGTQGAPVLRCREGRWEEISQLPQPLVQPVAHVAGGKLYVWGGFHPETLLAPSEGYCLDLESLQWSPAPAIPDEGTFVGATGVRLPDGRLLVVGGVNKAVFERALRNTPEDRIPYLSQDPAWYRFRSQVYLFDGNAWQLLGESPLAALAGPGVAADALRVYVSGGEIKPGVRSPRTFSFPY